MSNVKIGVILVGHGSKLHYNKDTIEHFASALREKGEYSFVEAAFMQINKPSIEEIMQKALDTGVDRLVIMPVFLERGMHLDHDVPEILALCAGETKRILSNGKKDVLMLYAEPLGKDSRILDIISDRIKATEQMAA